VRDTFLDRDTQILVQRDQPVVVRGLVEEGALNRHSVLGKERANLRVNFEARRESLAGGKIEQISGTRSSRGCALECRNQLGAPFDTKHTGNRSKPSLVDL
jgi:hypothetical protein